MARFLNFDRGLINADRVDRVARVRTGEDWEIAAFFSDGSAVRLSDGLEKIRLTLLPVVAAPGYTSLRYFTEWSEDGGSGVERARREGRAADLARAAYPRQAQGAARAWENDAGESAQKGASVGTLAVSSP